ncbi:MAG: DUF1989 domain-containing protein [Thermoleophilia bacterium]
MSTTSSTHGAREHARAQAGRRVESQPTLPATAADPPPGVAAADLLWDETLGDGAYASHRLPRGARLRLLDAVGDGCVTLMLHAANGTAERLNVADTVKVQWDAYPGAGSLLLSDMGRALATLEEDTSARHDTFCGAGPVARPRLLLAMAKHGLGRRDLPPALTLLVGVRIEPDGAVTLLAGRAPGTHVTLRAEADLIVSLVNAPHRLDDRPGHACSPVRVTAWQGPPTAPEDPLRAATPERLRAFENTDDALRGAGVRP